MSFFHESSEDVAMTIRYLESKGLIELVEGDEYFLNKVPEMLGSEAFSTERSRRHREKKKIESNSEVLQCNNKALQKNERATGCYEEIESEIELEKSHSYRDIQAFYENNGFGTLSSKTREDFIYWIKDFQKAGCTEKNAIKLIIHAMEKSIDNNVRKYAYINGILKDWEQKKVLNVDQVKAMDKQRKTGKAANERVWIKSGDDF
ncbi:DnaD domain protein [Enterococcus casseliflavus]|uniref:DnaD domain protein n=1 Tax=Enterococcus casseliflavus TaxID=37734 RepID=UPI002253CBDB|nr:DnaD domain protein [Enterococcus casseliflavus]MCX4168234.1 DnaD domain protein [Enterococcus casseliflavus]